MRRLAKGRMGRGSKGCVPVGNPTMPPAKCPSHDKLRAFQQGRISDACIEEITAHLTAVASPATPSLTIWKDRTIPSAICSVSTPSIFRRSRVPTARVKYRQVTEPTSSRMSAKWYPAMRFWKCWVPGAWVSSTRRINSTVHRVVALKMILACATRQRDRRMPLPRRGESGGASSTIPIWCTLHEVGAHQGQPYYSMRIHRRR